MKRRGNSRLLGAATVGGLLLLAGFFLFQLWFYTVAQLEIAKAEGIYVTPEAGMRTLIAESWNGVEKVEIDYAGTNSFDGSDPHVWFVVAKVWAASGSYGIPVGKKGYDLPGSFFLHTKEGWVHVPEGAFPELIGLGMRLFGLSGVQVE